MKWISECSWAWWKWVGGMVGVGSEREGSQRAEWAAIVRGRGHKRVTDEVTRRTMQEGETSKVQTESGRGEFVRPLVFWRCTHYYQGYC